MLNCLAAFINGAISLSLVLGFSISADTWINCFGILVDFAEFLESSGGLLTQFL